MAQSAKIPEGAAVPGRLHEKAAFITGAASGIGEASARAMVREGAAVALADINESGVLALAEELSMRGARALAMVLDVSDPVAVQTNYEIAVAELGRLDVLHLNAAAGRPDDSNVVDTPLEAWEDAFRLNVMSVVTGLKYGIPHLLAGGGGNIVVTSSGGGEAGDHSRIAYGSLKASVTALTRYVAVTHGRAGININAVLPGLVLSPGAATQFPAPLSAAVAKHQTTDRLTQPEDIAELVVFLASDDAKAIRGQGIRIDAGVSIQGGASPTLAQAIADLQAGVAEGA
ncbi:SDR family NAD(P)-dependent oxidoreductase [Quadrisphaera sp. KR29]|uniref:SDR family NAD(P)-dependent oxidoreductase n=1 Tax=Quadrisphaera sp. KR29 TaxID=3461391 RepID=UPI004044A477